MGDGRDSTETSKRDWQASEETPPDHNRKQHEATDSTRRKHTQREST